MPPTRDCRRGRRADSLVTCEKSVAYQLIGGVPATPGPGNDSYNYIDTNVFLKVGRSVALLRTVWITSNCDC